MGIAALSRRIDLIRPSQRNGIARFAGDVAPEWQWAWRGLVHAVVISNGDHPRDIISNTPLVLGTSTIAHTLGSLGEASGSFGTNGPYVVPDASLAGAAIWSCMLVCSHTAYAFQNAGMAIHRNTNAGAQAFIMYPNDNENASDGIRLWWQANRMNTVTVGIDDGYMHSHLLVNRSATDHEWFVDGESVDSITTSLTLGAGINFVRFGSWEDAQFFDGKINAMYVWAGTYPPPRGVLQLANDPLGLVRRKRRRATREDEVVTADLPFRYLFS